MLSTRKDLVINSVRVKFKPSKFKLYLLKKTWPGLQEL